MHFFQGVAETVTGTGARKAYLEEHRWLPTSSNAKLIPEDHADWEILDGGGPGGYLWYASFKCSSLEECFRVLQISASFGEVTPPDQIDELARWGDDVNRVEYILRESTWPGFSSTPKQVRQGYLFSKLTGGDCYLFLIDSESYRCFEHRQTGGILVD
ncbi:MAG: hypothetical protein JNL58_31360 [Planctomyces sp.]|nr:hypothetical protein [Planctomyces sp.]